MMTDDTGLGKLVTIDVEKGEIVIEIPDHMLEVGGKRVEEMFWRGKDIFEEATKSLCGSTC